MQAHWNLRGKPEDVAAVELVLHQVFNAELFGTSML
jgi:hypothetical protein